MSWFDKIMGAAKNKHEAQKEDITAQVKARLKKIVYDDSIVDELTPVFMSLQSVQGFDKVLDLLETKEKQIEAISGGEWFKQESDPDTQAPNTEEDTDVNPVELILKSKYEGK